LKSTDSARLVTISLSGTAVALVGLVGFGAVHALAIVAIWDRLGNGVVPALLAGLTQAWAFDWTVRNNAAFARRATLSKGARFGTLMFATTIPATVFSNALRLEGVAAGDWPATLAAIGLTLASGAVAGSRAAAGRGGILIYMAAALGLMIASAGTIPVADGVPAAWLFAGQLPILVAAGVVLSALRTRM